MLIENIKFRIKHQQPFDKDNINEKLKPINHLFDEIIIRSLSCVLKNDEKGYRITVNRNFIDFELKGVEDRDIVKVVINTLGLYGIAEDAKLTFIVKSNNFIKSFNNLFKDIPQDVNSEFIGFKYSINDINYYISMLLNVEDKLVCRIGLSLNGIDLDNIIEQLEEQNVIVNEKIIPLVKNFIEGVV